MILTILFLSGPSRPTYIDHNAMKIYSFEKRGATKRVHDNVLAGSPHEIQSNIKVFVK
jgi:hypothetical protein